jgi:S1-C subfamily serine protease
LTGTRAGDTRDLGATRLSIGRDPLCELRFDPMLDVDVSARHAELRAENGGAVLRDANSTNGTYVNGERIRGERTLRDGDVIQLGARGPKLRYDARSADAARAGGSTTERVAVAVRHQTRGLRLTLAVATGVIVVLAAGALWLSRSAATENARSLDVLRRRNDSLSAALDRDVHAMAGRMAGLDSALAQAKRESDELRQRLRQAVGSDGVRLLSSRVAEAETRRGAIMAAARLDYSAIVRANGAAVAMVAVEMPDGRMYSGTGFGVDSRGTIITNRHLVRNEAGQMPKRIAVIFADTRDWLPAHVEEVAGDGDLAVLRVDGDGPYPTVAGLAETAAAVGTPVALIGFPLGLATPMDNSSSQVVARTTLGVGTVAKVVPGVLQIDAYAAEGSSGSPVFSADGALVGVVYGGAEGSGGRIVYAIPSSAVRVLLGSR